MAAWPAVIDFRYHIVSLIAVFLALALGLFLGSTTLQSTVTNNLRHQADSVTANNRALTATNKQYKGQLAGEQALTAAVEPYAVSDRLAGESVAMVSAPGVDGKTRKSVANTLALAGATVTADVQVQAAFLDPTQDDLLAGLASELPLTGHTLPPGNGSTEMSSDLATVLVNRPGHHEVSRGQVTNLLSALSDGKFVNVSGSPPTHAASLAVVLVASPDANASTSAVTAQNTILTTLAADLRASSTGVVIAGPTPVAGPNEGTLAAARADSTLTQTVSTVNLDFGSGQDPAAGRIAIVLALAATPSGQLGAYGLNPPNGNPPLPAFSASP
jgi:Copper transport outer membrane protein, MctB